MTGKHHHTPDPLPTFVDPDEGRLFDPEAAVLRGLTWSPASRTEVFQLLEPRDFSNGRHVTIFEAMRDLHYDREPIDLMSVYDRLDRKDHIDAAGDMLYVHTVTRWQEFEGDPMHLAMAVLQRAKHARLTKVAEEILDDARNGDLDVDEAAQRLIAERGIERTTRIDLPEEFIEEVERRRHGLIEQKWSTGIGKLDDYYSVVPGLFTVVTGWPSSGKSTLVDTMLVNLATANDWRFLIFSAESAPTSRHMTILMRKLLSRPIDPTVSSEDMERAYQFIIKHFVWISTVDPISVEEVMETAAAKHRSQPFQGMVIDPWNQLEHDRPMSMREDEYIGKYLAKLTAFARKRDLHLWIVAHPTKPRDPTTPPGLYDVAGAAHWRNRSDMGLVVHRYDMMSAAVSVRSAKVRFRDHGKLGDVTLFFHEPSESMRDRPGPL